VALAGWFAASAYLQFLSSSFVSAAVGLALQTVLAVFLIARFRQSV
jgi:hypothetical protein